MPKQPETVLVLRKGKKESMKPGHKYIRRWRDPKTGEWLYEYPEDVLPKRGKKPAEAPKGRRAKKPDEVLDARTGEVMTRREAEQRGVPIMEVAETAAEERPEYTGDVIDLGFDPTQAWVMASRDIYRGSSPTDFARLATRETMQNSLDAMRRHRSTGAKKGGKLFRVSLDLMADVPSVTWEDDGEGMDALTLRNKFLKLHASGKRDDPNAVGGYGLAKAVIIGLAGDDGDWTVHTRDIEVTRAELGVVKSFRRVRERQGTKITITGGETVKKMADDATGRNGRWQHGSTFSWHQDDRDREMAGVWMPDDVLRPLFLTDLQPGETIEVNLTTRAELNGLEPGTYDITENLPPNVRMQVVVPKDLGASGVEWANVHIWRTGKLQPTEEAIMLEKGDQTTATISFVEAGTARLQVPSWAMVWGAPPKIVVRLGGMEMFELPMYGEGGREGFFLMDIETAARPGKGGGYPLDPGRSNLQRDMDDVVSRLRAKFASEPTSITAPKASWTNVDLASDPLALKANSSDELLDYYAHIGDFAGLGEAELGECLSLIYASENSQSLASKLYNEAAYTVIQYHAWEGMKKPEPQPLAKTLALAQMALRNISDYDELERRQQKVRAIGEYVRDHLDASFDQRVHESATEQLSLGDNLRLAVAWDTLVRVMADVGETQVSKVGFVCQSMEAAVETGIDRLGECEGEGYYATIRCNPYTLPRTTANVFARELWLLASHELTHAKGYGSHNQEFISEEAGIESKCFDVLRNLEHMVGTLAAHREARGKKRMTNTAKRYREAKPPELGRAIRIPPAEVRAFREKGLVNVDGKTALPSGYLDEIYWSWEQMGQPDFSGGWHGLRGVLEATDNRAERHYMTAQVMQMLDAHYDDYGFPAVNADGRPISAHFSAEYLSAVLSGMHAMYLRERFGRKPIPEALRPA